MPSEGFAIASMLVTAASPTLATGMTQERNGMPFTCTVQAPHKALPQPNFVPVKPSKSRKTHSREMSPSTSTSCSTPLTLILKAIDQLFSGRTITFCRLRHDFGIRITQCKGQSLGSAEVALVTSHADMAIVGFSNTLTSKMFQLGLLRAIPY